MVGVTGFEPATPASRTQCSGQAELHPDPRDQLRINRRDMNRPRFIASIECLCEPAYERRSVRNHMPSEADSRAFWAMLLTSHAVQGRILGLMGRSEIVD
jgi:hypothetical protein